MRSRPLGQEGAPPQRWVSPKPGTLGRARLQTGAPFLTSGLRPIPDARMALAMRWTKRFLRRLALSEPQASNPEKQPAEHAAPAIQPGVAGVLCTRCRRALVRNPHQVRAGRARARNATRDERGRFVMATHK